jgi:aminoglycoside phosphotransferase family enzyme
LSFLLAEAGRGEVTPGEAEKLARLVSEYHKAVQLTEIEERLRRMEEALGLEEALAAAPGPG